MILNPPSQCTFVLSVFKQSDMHFSIKSDDCIMKDSFDYYAVK